MPWHASATESLELELFIDPDPVVFFPETFSVHPPNELPTSITTDIFELVGGKHVEILITPNVIKADKSLKALAPSDRLCYFEGEQKLHFFEVYTQNNCEFNHLSDYSLNDCDCVPYLFPRNPDTRVCGFEENVKYTCYAKYWTRLKYAQPLTDSGFYEHPCLPPCNTISYDFEIIESKLQGHE